MMDLTKATRKALDDYAYFANETHACDERKMVLNKIEKDFVRDVRKVIEEAVQVKTKTPLQA